MIFWMNYVYIMQKIPLSFRISCICTIYVHSHLCSYGLQVRRHMCMYVCICVYGCQRCPPWPCSTLLRLGLPLEARAQHFHQFAFGSHCLCSLSTEIICGLAHLPTFICVLNTYTWGSSLHNETSLQTSFHILFIH